jgi:4-aminobutyrate aminotransferase-like enzyme
MSRVFSHHFSKEHPEVPMLLFVDGGYHGVMLGKCMMTGTKRSSPENFPHADKRI